MNKKQITLAAAIFLTAINISSAQFFYPVLEKFTPEKKEEIDKIYSINLESEHGCIVETALTIVTMIKLDLPSDELPKIRMTIDNLVTSGETPVIRYKAYLASAVFNSPALFKKEGLVNYRDSNELFAALSERLRQTLLITSN